MPNTEIRKFDGLYLQSNSFDVPDGAMEIAENVVIQSDNIISKTKGYFEYWRPGGGDTITGLKAIYTYEGHLIGAFQNGIGYYTNSFPFGDPYNSAGALTALAGVASGFTDYSFFVEANQNLYITGIAGNYALEAYDGKVRRVGVPPAISLSYSLLWTETGILPADSQTAYRSVFGRRDTNGNLLLSSPSDYLFIGMPAPVVAASYTITGGVGVVLGDDDYFIDQSNFFTFRTGQTIIISSATNPLLNGSQILVDPSPGMGEAFRFATAEPDGTGTLTYSPLGTPTLRIDIPSEIQDLTEEWFYQVYRTSPSLTVEGSPITDFKLVTETVIVQADIDLGWTRFTDNIATLLLGAELYTNPNTREGEGQANSRPPWANVIANYKGYMLYSDVQTVQRMTLNFVNNIGFHGRRRLLFRCNGVTETYVPFLDRSPNSLYGIDQPVTGTGTGVITIDDPVNEPLVGDKFEIWDVTGTLLPGRYTILTIPSPGFYTINATGKTMTAGTVRFYQQVGGEYLYQAFTADNLAAQVNAVVQSINLNSSFMYAHYASVFDNLPGTMYIESKQPTLPIYVAMEVDPGSLEPDLPIFIQPVPPDFVTGKQIYSENDVLPNATFVAKVGEPEAAPPTNYFLIGESTSRTLATYPLRDCVIVVKEDGVFKISGDIVSDFQIVPIDTTVHFPVGAVRAASCINNTVLAISNQGIVQITENSVQVISRRIDDGIQPLVGRSYATTFLGGNEGDRLFYTNTSGINEGDPDVCWVYNVLNQTWTNTTEVFKHLAIGPGDETFGILFDADAGSDVIHRQRKTQTLVDYCGKYTRGNLTVAADKMSATFVVTGGNPVSPGIGDVILYSNVFTRIVTSKAAGGGFEFTFAQQTNIPTPGPTAVTVYKAYRSTVKMAPFHAGQVTLSKHFSQMQIHLRQAAISDIKITFAGAYFGSSELTNWSLANISSSGSYGWGFSPWGFFPWGLADGIKLTAGTQAATIIRTYVPRFAARNTFIQCQIVHQIAGQPMFIQALGYDVRGYGSRTSK